MRNNFDNFQRMLISETSKEVSGSVGQNHPKQTMKQMNSNAKQRVERRKLNEKTEQAEQQKADENLDKNLDSLGASISSMSELSVFLDKNFPDNKEVEKIAVEYFNNQKLLSFSIDRKILEQYLFKALDNKENITTADQIKNYKDQLTKDGKTPTKILQLLISKFENERAVSTWVENWKNFLKLHQFAQNKSPAERKAIESVINNSNFTTENSFELVLIEIEKNTDISTQTKLDIQRTFKTTGIKTVRAFDHTLKKEKHYKKSIEKKIQTRNTDIETLNNEISNLNAQLEKLPPNDPKRTELETKLKKKGEILKTYKQEITTLKEAKPDTIQFQLRKDLTATLNPDGNRSIKIATENFTIQLPNNNLPFMGTKNLRSINVAFPFLALRPLHISNEIFAPDLTNKEIPTKKQRDTAHLILSSLGIDDNHILSEKDINQLKNDLSYLVDTKSGKTGRECLIELGIYDVASQHMDKNQLKKVLQLIRNNRKNKINYKIIQEELL